MNPSELTENSLLSILRDPGRCADLIATMEREQGSYLPVNNRYFDVAERCIATPDELRTTIHSLLDVSVSHDRLIWPFIFHPHVPDDVLFELYDSGRCLIAMSHREGPQQLLERLAADHHLSEAITTLALSYYSKPEVSTEAFIRFLVTYKDDFMLKGTMTRAAAGTLKRKGVLTLSDAKREAVQVVFNV